MDSKKTREIKKLKLYIIITEIKDHRNKESVLGKFKTIDSSFNKFKTLFLPFNIKDFAFLD